MTIITTLNDPASYEKIHTLNRVQLIDDALTFSETGNLEYRITFELLNYLEHEKEYTPWLAALGGLNPMNRLLKRTHNQGTFQVSGITFILFITIIWY